MNINENSRYMEVRKNIPVDILKLIDGHNEAFIEMHKNRLRSRKEVQTYKMKCNAQFFNSSKTVEQDKICER